MNAPRVRPATSSDADAVAALHRRAFGRPFSAEAWRWKFATHLAADRASDPPWVFVAVDDADRPIGQYGGMPRTLRLPGGLNERAVVVSDGMTDPHHRRRGVLTRMVETAHDTWRQAGVACVFGLPNEQWGSRTEALGWQPLYPLPWRLRPLRPEALAGRRLGWPWLGRRTLAGRLLNRFADRSLCPTEECAVHMVASADPVDPTPGSGDAALVRDRAFLEWRFRASAHHRYAVLSVAGDPRENDPSRGYLAWRLDRSSELPFGIVAAWEASDVEARKALLWAALVAMRRSDAAAAAVLVPAGQPEDPLLRRAAFRRGWGAFSVSCVPLASHLPLDVLRDPSRFPLTGADFDVV